MVNRSTLEIYFKVLLPLLLVPLLLIAPIPKEAARSLEGVNLAVAHDRPRLAAGNLARAAAYFPWRADLWEQAGVYAVQASDFDLGRQYLEQAASAGELSISGQVALGDANKQLGNLDAAIRIWENARLSHPNLLGIHERLLDAHLLQNDDRAVIADLEALVVLRPSEARYSYRLGLLYAAFQPERAGAYLLHAAALDPAIAGQANAVSRSIRIASFEDEPAYIFLEAGRSLAAIEEWDLAAQAFRRAAVLRPDYAEAWAFLGEAYQHTRTPADQEKALPALQTSLALNPESLAVYSLIALYYERQEAYDLAMSHLQQAAAADPDNPTWWAESGRIAAKSGELQLATNHYVRAVSLAPRSPTYWKLLAEFSLLHQVQVREIALPAVRQALALAPQDAEALDLMGQTLFFLQDYASAERFLLRAMLVDPAYAPAHLHLGMTYLLQGEAASAHEQIVLARSLAPESPTAALAQRLLLRYFP